MSTGTSGISELTGGNIDPADGMPPRFRVWQRWADARCDDDDYFIRDRIYDIDHGPYDRQIAHALCHVWNEEEQEYQS